MWKIIGLYGLALGALWKKIDLFSKGSKIFKASLELWVKIGPTPTVQSNFKIGILPQFNSLKDHKEAPP